jgi:hypothetical protein
MLLASVERLEKLTGAVGSADGYLRAEELLRQSSNLARSHGIDSWDEDTVPGRVADIVVQAAYRAYTNPDGASQKTVGDVSVSYSRTGLQGAVYLTKDEKRDIRRAAGRAAQAVVLVSPYSGDDVEVES